MPSLSEHAHLLRTPEAVRNRCAEMLAMGEADELDNFRVHADKLGDTASLVVDNIRRNYPSLNVPHHSRWRHFDVDGESRWLKLEALVLDTEASNMARTKFDVCIVSVLLDAGAGSKWHYQDKQSGRRFSRSEGLALASLALLESGALSCHRDERVRVDAKSLLSLDENVLADAFQITADNPLAGQEGRLSLLRRLGEIVLERTDVFGAKLPRPGHLFDYLRSLSVGGKLAARDILLTILDTLSPIWPGRLQLNGLALGDVWRHPALHRGDETDGLLPLHKLSQWLTYSLIEPLEQAGTTVVDIEALTGLAEYRNGGLFIDAGVLTLRDAAAGEQVHAVDSVLVVEWRALTVALLDRLAPLVRAELGLSNEQLPLSRILEGGTWSTGRELARARREDGRPPLSVSSDGTVF